LSGLVKANRVKTASISASICLFLSCLGVLIVTVPGVAAESVNRVEFRLKPGDAGRGAIDVILRFNLESGSSAFVKPSKGDGRSAPSGCGVKYELSGEPPTGCTVEPLGEGEQGWKVTATAGGPVELLYTVIPPAGKSPLEASETPWGAESGPGVFLPDLTVFKGSCALLCPRDAEKETFLGEEYSLAFDIPGKRSALVPFEKKGESYVVEEADRILGNLACWGSLSIEGGGSRGTDVTIGYAGKYAGGSDDLKKKYSDGLLDLLDRAAAMLGERTGLDRLTVTVGEADLAAGGAPSFTAMADSIAIFQDGALELGKEGAPLAAGALFGLWNGWSMVPEPGGDAFWFQYGLAGIYPGRLAVLAGLMKQDTAYEEFSRTYTAYLADPRSRTLTLEEAWLAGDTEFVSRKATVLCAALDGRLRELTEGERDIDWLAGRIAGKFDHFEGRDYTLIDIEEALVEATGKSWARFLDEGLRGTRLIEVSEFSSTKLFGSDTSIGRELDVKGSGKGWILLVVAVAVILLIPLIFSSYVRRAVRLDVSMPKILDDE